MKKWCVILIGMCFCSPGANAQLFNELFRQKETQRRYLAEQIAFLQVHLSSLKKGYDIARDGIGLVDRLKKGEFNLHDVFFTSLKTVSPSIRHGATVTAIIESLDVTVAALSSHSRMLRTAGVTTLPRPPGVQEVLRKRFTLVEQLSGELISLITSGKLEMSDDQRNQRLEALLALCRTVENAARHEERSAKMLMIQHQREAAELRYLKILNNL